MSAEILSRFAVGDTVVLYRIDRESGRVGLLLVPAAMEGRRVARRASLKGELAIDLLGGAAPAAEPLDPLVHLKLVGDPYTGAFAQGHTMRASPSNDRFRFSTQQVTHDNRRTAVMTTLRREEGLRVEHFLAWEDDAPVFEVWTRFINESTTAATLEMLTSFSLGGLTPFAADDAPGRLRAHRFQSAWSAEARLRTESVESLHLERSWSGAAAFSVRFGQVGTMPVRGWFPCAAAEDVEAGVTWGAQLAWAGSWQMELFRQHDDLCISGGLADREFGHWTKRVEAGESFQTPVAALACVAGGLDELCDRLTSLQQRPLATIPAVERDLPVVFNEWCTTWGDPSHERLAGIAESLKGLGAKYLVIDAGWYKTGTTDWSSGHGDWIPSPALFPSGLEATAAMIRDAGLIPGLWFEMETVGEQSAAWTLDKLLLHRDGMPISVRQRRFWNLCDPEAVDHLSRRVIDLLERCGFGYLKVDYNETLGIGCEDGGAESLGEGLRRHVEGVHRFFDRIRQRLPALVIENCSSGGHRLEPSMLGRSAMSSFSDAHELVEIPIIAANLHRLVLPRQSQIWAVLHAADDARRTVYSLAATFLGRMCLSGEIDRLSAPQRETVRRATQLYARASNIIAHGTSRRQGTLGESWRHPRGWQSVVRVEDGGNRALVVSHAFAAAPLRPVITLPAGRWMLEDELRSTKAASVIEDNRMTCALDSDFSAAVTLLRRA